MKNILFILTILLMLSCKAQTIISLYAPGSNRPQSPYYMKDVDGDMNPYVGTWQWVNGTSSLTIQLIKVEMAPDGFGDFSDYLIGEYRYVENGVEMVNTLPVTYTSGENPYGRDKHSIGIGNITTVNRGFPPCLTCPQGTRYMLGYFSDPTRIDNEVNAPLGGRLYMVHTIDNGVEKLIIRIFPAPIVGWKDNYTGATEMSIPAGRYTLIKQ